MIKKYQEMKKKKSIIKCNETVKNQYKWNENVM